MDKMGQKEYRKFGIIMALMIAVFFAVLLPWLFKWQYSNVPWLISAAILLWSLFSPKSLVLIYKPWILLGNMLAYVNTRIILGFVFFGMFVPIALLLKMVNRVPISKKINMQIHSSYWEEKIAQDKQHMEKIY
jgi:hypothetical protein